MVDQSGTRPRRRQGGASESRASARHRLASYVQHHRRTLVSSFQRLLAKPVQSLMTVLVIAIAMALPAALYVAVSNLQQLAGGVELNARMSVFIEKGVDEEEIAALVAELETRDDVTAIVYMSADRALEEFREASGFADVLALLEENPLPPAILVEPADHIANDQAAAEALVDWLQGREIVDEVSVDLAWLQKLHALVQVGRQLALGLGVVLGMGVLLVMGNTIRLAIESRRDEIVVVKLIGGTDGYVRRPFLYSGLWYGLAGGAFSWLLVGLGFWSLGNEIQALATLYQSGYSLSGPGGAVLLTLLVCGALLGLGGAWIAVSSHLRGIEPE